MKKSPGLRLAVLFCLVAAVLHDRVTQMPLKQALTSYSDVAETERYQWPLSAFVPGVLQSFDLPDCYRELQRKKLDRLNLFPPPASPPD